MSTNLPVTRKISRLWSWLFIYSSCVTKKSRSEAVFQLTYPSCVQTNVSSREAVNSNNFSTVVILIQPCSSALYSRCHGNTFTCSPVIKVKMLYNLNISSWGSQRHHDGQFCKRATRFLSQGLLFPVHFLMYHTIC